MSWLAFVSDSLAVYRMTRFVTEDELMAPVREWIWKHHDPEETKLGYFVTCPWCVSVYLGGAVVAARAVAPKPWGMAAQGLSFSALTGLIASRS